MWESRVNTDPKDEEAAVRCEQTLSGRMCMGSQKYSADPRGSLGEQDLVESKEDRALLPGKRV